MAKQLIAVIVGGPSFEYEVSLNTGKVVMSQLDTQKYDILKVHISKDRRWYVDDSSDAQSMTQVLEQLRDKQAIAFIAVHGNYGEDGTIQALLNLYKIPYTGSSVAASLLAMDKITSQELFEASGLKAPQLVSCNKNTVGTVTELVRQTFTTYPLVVKPAKLGSSVGVRIIKAEDELLAAVNDALLYDQEALVQEFIKGREVSCGVLHRNDQLIALVPTELTPVISEFFDYKAKYQDGGTKEVTPPDMSPETIAEIQAIAVKAHQILGCKSYSRTDMIVTGTGIYVLETNTLPGMTQNSILPQQAKAAGIPFPELLDTIIDNAKAGV